MERAENEWDGLWQTGKKHRKQETKEELPPLTIKPLETVLCKLSPDKALGPDHWHPKELLALSTKLKQSLINIIHRAEKEGVWPQGIKKSTIALINKPGATHEGQLRPIGLLTYVYRTWMAIRRQTQQGWTQKLHGITTPSAVELARETKKMRK